VSVDEFNDKNLKFLAGRDHPGGYSRIHIPGNLSPVYKVDEIKYNNDNFDDIYDREKKVIKLFQIDEY
jgi:hypothetical protein